MKQKKNTARKPQSDPKSQEKKQYARPEIVKHGNVETMTQTRRGWHGGPSGPIDS